MTNEAQDICDKLEEAQAMVAFMSEATAALLKVDTGTLPGKNMLWGMACVYEHIGTQLKGVTKQVSVLSA